MIPFISQMQKGEILDMSGQIFKFLSNVIPFNTLPEDKIRSVASKLKTKDCPADKLLFVQGETVLEDLYIIKKGKAERFFTATGGQEAFSEFLGEKDIYGGGSILFNETVSLLSLRTIESAQFYTLHKDVFLELCEEYAEFNQYIVDSCIQRRINKNSITHGEEGSSSENHEFQYLNQPIENFCSKNTVSCDADMSIQKSAVLMTQKKCGSVLVKNSKGDFVGIVTDFDLRKKVIAQGYSIDRPVSEIMSSPLISINAKAFMFESLVMMMEKNIKHLPVVDDNDNIIGLISNRDLLGSRGSSPFLLIREINQAKTAEEIAISRKQIYPIIQNLVNNGAKPEHLTRIITIVSDTILYKLIQFAIDKIGPAPCKFVFMILGSEGRQEQTLKTDQDNAIVFEDVPPEQRDKTQKYFLDMGELVCTWLDQIGYDFCKGDTMAKNPKLCQPLAKWKKYFSEWIHAPEPEDLLQAGIFFDLRRGYGDINLIEDLQEHLFASIRGWAGFLRNITENTLYFKPPLGVFKNFVVESKGKYKNSFDIKAAMTPIVNLARIYSLDNGIEQTNTLERLHQLFLKQVFTAQEYEEIYYIYSYLMRVRFARQVSAIMKENALPHNYINPKTLSSVEQKTLKEIFKKIGQLQTKLSFQFTGVI